MEDLPSVTTLQSFEAEICIDKCLPFEGVSTQVFFLRVVILLLEKIKLIPHLSISGITYCHYVMLWKITDELDNLFVIPFDIYNKVQKDVNGNNYVRH